MGGECALHPFPGAVPPDFRMGNPCKPRAKTLAAAFKTVPVLRFIGNIDKAVPLFIQEEPPQTHVSCACARPSDNGVFVNVIVLVDIIWHIGRGMVSSLGSPLEKDHPSLIPRHSMSRELTPFQLYPNSI